MEYVSKSAEETQSLAADFARQLQGGEVIALIGDLGAGKTTFVRGVVQALGGTVKVKSPTFTVMNEYPVGFDQIKRVVHIDFYRFNSPEELSVLSLEDERRSDTVIFAEWPNVFQNMVISPSHEITFDYGLKETERQIVINVF
jgi:tRNA threonylcarbamoyladenosine biosynthesis protein TsaE